MVKKISVIFATLVLVLVLIGVFYSVLQDDDIDPITVSSNIVALSLDTNILKIEGGTVYILEGTSQEDILNNLISEDDSTQTYRVATSEGSNKTKDEIYEYDRLYVMAENGVKEVYYMILFFDSLDWQARESYYV